MPVLGARSVLSTRASRASSRTARFKATRKQDRAVANRDCTLPSRHMIVTDLLLWIVGLWPADHDKGRPVVRVGQFEALLDLGEPHGGRNSTAALQMPVEARQ